MYGSVSGSAGATSFSAWSRASWDASQEIRDGITDTYLQSFTLGDTQATALFSPFTPASTMSLLLPEVHASQGG